jgi:hypothetical protein
MELKKDIGTFEHFLSAGECDEIVDMFEVGLKRGKGVTRKQLGDKSTFRSDIQMQFSVTDFFPSCLENFQTKFWDIAWNSYEENYNSLTDGGEGYVWYGMKIQKISPREGYHAWHYENSGTRVLSRVLAFILYLNDDFEAGETEFLYKSLRTAPKKGTLVLFPAGYTHTHRGNPPINGKKYIMTGWVNRA